MIGAQACAPPLIGITFLGSSQWSIRSAQFAPWMIPAIATWLVKRKHLLRVEKLRDSWISRVFVGDMCVIPRP
jgi:hypothetical protein